jgi:cytochrome c
MMKLSLAAVLGAAMIAGPAAAQEFGDAERGAKAYRQCASCHDVGEGARHRVGPHLNGIFGRRAGSIEDYTRYSKGLVREGVDGLFWDLRRLDAYIENPKALVSDTRMAFRGIKDAEERADVLAYLRLFSDDPANIPEAAPTATPREVDLAPEVLAISGDADYGEYLSTECMTCHQSDGDDEGVPSITGWPEEDFVVAMHAYKQKIRPHPVMQMFATRLSDEEIAALAAYYGGL